MNSLENPKTPPHSTNPTNSVYSGYLPPIGKKSKRVRNPNELTELDSVRRNLFEPILPAQISYSLNTPISQNQRTHYDNPQAPVKIRKTRRNISSSIVRTLNFDI